MRMTNTKRKNIVNIVKCEGDEVKSAVYNALNGLKYTSKKEINSVVIKPNLCYYWDASTGETTDKRIVSAVIDYVREFYNPNAHIKIAEADATAMKTKYSFKTLGYTELSKEKGVELFNLSEDDFKEINVKTNKGLLKIPIPLTMLNSDLLINIPKLKVPRRVPLTCAMKNLFGCIHDPIKAKYHPHLHEVIATVNSVVKPDLTVVDGIIALGRHPIKLNIIIAGTDTISVDWTVAKIIGYKNPRKIRYLRLGEEMRAGSSSIELIGENIGEIARKFPRINTTILGYLWSIQLRGIKIYSIITGDIIPPILGDL